MLLHYLRAALANLRIRKQTALINVIGLTLGLTCFVLAYVMSEYLASADRHFASSDRIYVIQERVVAPGEDTSKPFFTSTPPALARYVRAAIPELEAVTRWNDMGLRVGNGDRFFGQIVLFAD